jgi:hypothetical protein
LEENWIEMRLRYVVEPRKRRAISNNLVSSILEAFEKEEDIMVGTAVGIDLMNNQGEVFSNTEIDSYQKVLPFLYPWEGKSPVCP